MFLDRKQKLLFILGAFLISDAIVAEMIGGKIFSLEKTLGFQPFTFDLLGEKNLSFQLTAGVLFWPLVFIITDIINEYFGPKVVRFISFIAAALIAFAFIAVYLAIRLVPADWWPSAYQKQGLADAQVAYKVIFGQGMWIIIGSISAFFIGQISDAFIFDKIKKRTGEKHIWLRATGSTLVSQLIDSFVVIIIAFKLGQDWTWPKVIAIALVGYSYKFVIAIILTPVLYLVHSVVDVYLGKEK